MFESTGGTRSVVRAGKKLVELRFSKLSVTVIEGPDAGRTVDAASCPVRIGTSSSCDLVLSDPAVSRKHLMVSMGPDGIQVEDLGSKNGTWLDGTRVKEAVVPEGAVLRVGVTRLRVRSSTDAVEIGASGRHEFQGLVSCTDSMREIFALVEKLASHDLPVMILGETGTGKELFARALHQTGARRSRPFQILDCGSAAREILPSELFGHEKGAFTGADERRAGIFEQAEGGTVVLDEIAEIPLNMQPNLLRVLESRELTRLGSRKVIPVKFRIVSSTNRDLKEMSEEGLFRKDLYFRLSTVVIRIPPLRDRPQDIPLLAQHFLDQLAREHATGSPRLSAGAVDRLRRHPWPGNVRELRNLMSALTVLGPGGELTPGMLEPLLSGRASLPGNHVTPSVPAPPARSAPASEDLREIEAQAVRSALEATGWNIREAAKRLGIARNTLYQKMARSGMKRPGSQDV